MSMWTCCRNEQFILIEPHVDMCVCFMLCSLQISACNSIRLRCSNHHVGFAGNHLRIPKHIGYVSYGTRLSFSEKYTENRLCKHELSKDHGIMGLWTKSWIPCIHRNRYISATIYAMFFIRSVGMHRIIYSSISDYISLFIWIIGTKNKKKPPCM